LNWQTNPRPLDHWKEAFLAYRHCLKALPPDSDICITGEMISPKCEFHRQAQEVRTPAKVLFFDKEGETDSYKNHPTVPELTPFKPTLDVSLPGFVGWDKKLAKHVQLVKDSLSLATQNLIHQKGALQDQDNLLSKNQKRKPSLQVYFESNSPSSLSLPILIVHK
jgi:hypothetical protein